MFDGLTVFFDALALRLDELRDEAGPVFDLLRELGNDTA